MLMFKIHHIGYIVSDVNSAVETMKLLNYEILQSTVYDEDRNIYICFIKNCNQIIELIQPKDETAVTYKLLTKTGPSPYHICYEVKNIEEACNRLKETGFYPITKIERASAMGRDKSVIFLYSQTIGLIELVSNSIL